MVASAARAVLAFDDGNEDAAAFLKMSAGAAETPAPAPAPTTATAQPALTAALPESFAGGIPENVAFVHIDMNSVSGEIGALEGLFDRMSPGGIIILDDYGWHGYRAQQQAEQSWFAARGKRVLELPTGQGMVIR